MKRQSRPADPGADDQQRPATRAVAVLAIVVLFFVAISSSQDPGAKTTFAQFLRDVEARRVDSAEMRVRDNTVRVKLDSGQRYSVGFVDAYGGQLTHARRMPSVTAPSTPSASSAASRHGRRCFQFFCRS